MPHVRAVLQRLSSVDHESFVRQFGPVVNAVANVLFVDRMAALKLPVPEAEATASPALQAAFRNARLGFVWRDFCRETKLVPVDDLIVKPTGAGYVWMKSYSDRTGDDALMRRHLDSLSVFQKRALLSFCRSFSAEMHKTRYEMLSNGLSTVNGRRHCSLIGISGFDAGLDALCHLKRMVDAPEIANDPALADTRRKWSNNLGLVEAPRPA